ncbi:type II secretion system protein F [Arcanobacterium haemolyticum]|uniref:type II secretion system F family protein n=1 Tax=Arcanobacterium haemolyticum TaxID=28264 RepID=UPI001110948D|nr:type II secretion system F family protein [Arcanobacterium haemolyticum]QCX47010.1 type II secretion system protein F [Arcanobacterium haemolyticum]
MGFVIGALIGSGMLLVLRAWEEPRPLLLPRPVVVSVGWACAGGVASFVLIRSLPIVVCCAVVAGLVPVLRRSARVRRREEACRDAWPDVLDDVVASLRAGLSVSQSLAMVGERGPELMREPFSRCATMIRAQGRMGPALDELKAEFADPMADRVLEAMRLSHELGGRDLATMLARLAAVIREDNRARGELLARQSWTVNGARMAAAAPWALLGLFSTRPGTVEAFSSPAGIAVLCGGVIVTALAYVAMIKLGQLTVDSRVFVSSPAKAES